MSAKIYNQLTTIPWSKFIPLGFMLILMLAILAMGKKQHVPLEADIANARIYHGVTLSQNEDVVATAKSLEQSIGKGFSILHITVKWPDESQQFFPTDLVSEIRSHGPIPLISWTLGDPNNNTVPEYSFESINAGNHDAYITNWAQSAKVWSHPLFIRLDPAIHNLAPNEYIQAWRHIVRIFEQNEVSNVSWVWCQEPSGKEISQLAAMYPGNDFVDWTCIDGLNAELMYDETSQRLTDAFSHSYLEIMNLAGSKPMMALNIQPFNNHMILDLLTRVFPKDYLNVKAVVWSHNFISTIEDEQSREAYQQSLSSEIYAPNAYHKLSQSPIPDAQKIIFDQNGNKKK